MIQRVLIWGNLSLIALLGYNVALGAVGYLEKQLESTIVMLPATPSISVPVSKEREPFSVELVEQILDANAFQVNRNPQPLPEILPPNGKVVASRLAIKLVGTALLGKISFAFIANENNDKQRAYQPNDCLPAEEKISECGDEYGKLVKINHKSVDIKYNGQTQNYQIEQGDIPVVSSIKNGSRASARPLAASSNLLPYTRKGKRIDVNVPNIEVQKAFENFSSILKQALVVPYEENGQPQGFKIKKIVPGGVFARLHLKNNDVITSVNGNDLSTADQAIQLLNAFRNEKEVNLEVKRNGKPVQLRYLIQ